MAADIRLTPSDMLNDRNTGTVFAHSYPKLLLPRKPGRAMTMGMFPPVRQARVSTARRVGEVDNRRPLDLPACR